MVLEANNNYNESYNKKTIFRNSKRDYENEIKKCMDQIKKEELSLEIKQYLQIMIHALIEEKQEEEQFYFKRK